jgi:hypothetical protein
VTFQNPSTINTSVVWRSIICIKAPMLCGCSSLKQRFRPCALGIIGLAIAVVLWGAGYKLSLYHRHATRSPVPVAKLWIESRNASVTAASRFKAKSHLVPDSQAFSVPTQRLPHLSRAVACILPVCTRGVAHFDFLIPFRSPPPPHFFFA